MRTLADDLLTVSEAAALLRVAPSTIRRWIRAGSVAAYRAGPRRLALKRADVAQMISSTQERDGTPHFRTTTHADEIRPPTHEEWERGMAAMEDAKRISAAILARWGGKPFPPSWEILAELRDERIRQLP